MVWDWSGCCGVAGDRFVGWAACMRTIYAAKRTHTHTQTLANWLFAFTRPSAPPEFASCLNSTWKKCTLCAWQRLIYKVAVMLHVHHLLAYAFFHFHNLLIHSYLCTRVKTMYWRERGNWKLSLAPNKWKGVEHGAEKGVMLHVASYCAGKIVTKWLCQIRLAQQQNNHARALFDCHNSAIAGRSTCKGKAHRICTHYLGLAPSGTMNEISGMFFKYFLTLPFRFYKSSFYYFETFFSFHVFFLFFFLPLCCSRRLSESFCRFACFQNA